jgi:TrmH family RNA methyltransferase
MERISSRDNPLLVRVRKLVQDPTAYRKLGLVWLEGDHLVAAALQRGWRLSELVFAESAWEGRADWRAWAGGAERVVGVPDALFKGMSSLESAASVGATVCLPDADGIRAGHMTVLLDRIQDPGNLGSLMRSAAAFGVRQVLALKGCAGLWSPKVLRAGMGAHFGLSQVREGLEIDDIPALGLPWLATSSHTGEVLGVAKLPSPCVWVFGHEGQGVREELLERCELTVRIAQPGGEESLNVAAAAAICLFVSSCGLAVGAPSSDPAAGAVNQ